MAVLVSLRACSGARVGVDIGEVASVGAFVLGVMLCLESLSDGAREVAGVSRPSVAVVVDASDARLSSRVEAFGWSTGCGAGRLA